MVYLINSMKQESFPRFIGDQDTINLRFYLKTFSNRI